MEKTLQLTVSELSKLIAQTLENSFYNLSIEGEISGFSQASSGHWYFSLKDRESLINATMWRNANSKTGFIPKDGQKVIVTGNVTTYSPRSLYQINCLSMRLCGEGDILAMLEQRKKKYASMGWFDQSLKKQIPVRPEKVAVITSATGAALQDILQVTERRNKGLDIIILPAQVQGQSAAYEIAARIKEVNKYKLAPVIIVGRGGGSIEDLLAFSEDVVINAIHESEIPVISAVGHEIDWAISDYVADLRASTPSAAAELVCKSGEAHVEMLNLLKKKLFDGVSSKLAEVKLAFNSVGVKNIEHPVLNKISTAHYDLELKIQTIRQTVDSLLVKYRHSFDVINNLLKVINPASVLNRGYSIVSTTKGKTIRSKKDVNKDSELRIRISDGIIEAKVQEVL